MGKFLPDGHFTLHPFDNVDMNAGMVPKELKTKGQTWTYEGGGATLDGGADTYEGGRAATYGYEGGGGATFEGGADTHEEVVLRTATRDVARPAREVVLPWVAP